MICRGFFISLFAALILSACTQRAEQQHLSQQVDTASTVISAPTAERAEPARIDSTMGFPISAEWIPGQRDTEDFDVLSKYRAHEKRLSSQLLVLTLDTPAVSTKGAGGKTYFVADSAVVTHLSYGDSFKNDCKTVSGAGNGLVTGIVSTNQGRQHPRLAWMFDTVTLKILALPPDSVWCVQEEVD